MKLKKIDLKKAKLLPSNYDHPDIKENGPYYLAKIEMHREHTSWYCGQFSRQWYGLNFEAVFSAGYQFDRMLERTEELYEIVE